MLRLIRYAPLVAILLALALPAQAETDDTQSDTLLVNHPEILISATRTQRKQVDIPNGTAVITRDELRRRNVRTLADAIQDIVGVDAADGSDNGSRIPNVGLWGLKEFDALLFTLNGVPVGGPFNPSLAQIPVDDIERIEIVKGPQGTMYGVSAFAGMIQVFTTSAQSGGEIAAGGGSFTQGHGRFDWGKTLENDRTLRLSGAYGHSDGFQDRTESNVGRGSLTFGFGLGSGRMTLDLNALKDEQDWGSPLPYSQGALVPGFEIDRNYAVKGAEVGHEVFGGTARLTWPVGSHRIENTLSVIRDNQDYLRSFPGEIAGDTLESEALELEPEETSLYEDLRWIGHLTAKGTHELVAGAALTFGKTEGEGREFEFDQLLSAYPSSIPDADQVPSAEDREFEDERRFLGVYVHDAWTPTERVTFEAGGRFDAVEEELETEADLPSGPVPVADKREDSDFSGDASVLYRLLPSEGRGKLQAANLYGSVRKGFKPAAPNLAEAEAAEILEPEHTTSWEVGLKTRATEGLALDLSYFDMKFEDMVVSILGSGGLPELTNAGEQRFKGFEANLSCSPTRLPGSTFQIGYAYHDARFTDFTFIADGAEVDVSGNRLELVPRDLVNGRVSLMTQRGIGGFVAARYQGERPFNRRNTFFADAFTQWDAGLSYDHAAWRVAVAGRNLGDDRSVVTESEIGDAQFYVSPPRRFTAEVGYRF